MRSTSGPLRILFRDRDWLAVDKPSAIPTTAPPGSGVRSLVDAVREGPAAGARHAHPLSRLDVEVTGVVLFALSDAAIERATRAKTQRAYDRRYVALVSPLPEPSEGCWDWSVGIDPRDARRRIAGGGRDPRPALTRYTTLSRAGAIAWIALDLETGRTHQIRVHARRAGCPVVGDVKYGGPRHLALADGAVVRAPRVMLHALRVRVPFSACEVRAEPPEDFLTLWRECGGTEVPKG